MNDAGCNGFSSFFLPWPHKPICFSAMDGGGQAPPKYYFTFFFSSSSSSCWKMNCNSSYIGKTSSSPIGFSQVAVIIVIIAQSSHILFRLFSSSFSFRCLRDSLVWWWALLLASSSVADISRGSCEKRLDSISPSFFDWRFFLILSRKFDDSLKPIKTFPKITRR